MCKTISLYVVRSIIYVVRWAVYLLLAILAEDSFVKRQAISSFFHTILLSMKRPSESAADEERQRSMQCTWFNCTKCHEWHTNSYNWQHHGYLGTTGQSVWLCASCSAAWLQLQQNAVARGACSGAAWLGAWPRICRKLSESLKA